MKLTSYLGCFFWDQVLVHGTKELHPETLPAYLDWSIKQGNFFLGGAGVCLLSIMQKNLSLECLNLMKP